MQDQDSDSSRSSPPNYEQAENTDAREEARGNAGDSSSDSCEDSDHDDASSLSDSRLLPSDRSSPHPDAEDSDLDSSDAESSSSDAQPASEAQSVQTPKQPITSWLSPSSD